MIMTFILYLINRIMRLHFFLKMFRSAKNQIKFPNPLHIKSKMKYCSFNYTRTLQWEGKVDINNKSTKRHIEVYADSVSILGVVQIVHSHGNDVKSRHSDCCNLLASGHSQRPGVSQWGCLSRLFHTPTTCPWVSKDGQEEIEIVEDFQDMYCK